MSKWNKNYNFKNIKINIGMIEIISGLAVICVLAMFTIMITTVILGILGKIGIMLTNYMVIISLITVFFSLVFILNKYLLK